MQLRVLPVFPDSLPVLESHRLPQARDHPELWAQLFPSPSLPLTADGQVSWEERPPSEGGFLIVSLMVPHRLLATVPAWLGSACTGRSPVQAGGPAGARLHPAAWTGACRNPATVPSSGACPHPAEGQGHVHLYPVRQTGNCCSESPGGWGDPGHTAGEQGARMQPSSPGPCVLHPRPARTT